MHNIIYIYITHNILCMYTIYIYIIMRSSCNGNGIMGYSKNPPFWQLSLDPRNSSTAMASSCCVFFRISPESGCVFDVFDVRIVPALMAFVFVIGVQRNLPLSGFNLPEKLPRFFVKHPQRAS